MTGSWKDVARELSRARAARRMAPWVAISAIAAAALVLAVGHRWQAAAAMLVPGLLFYGIIAAAAAPRCPACGGRLLRRGESPGSPAAPRPTQVERERRCPRCGVQWA